MTRVLVTGAAGFLGRAFVTHHMAQGDYVVAVDDMSNPHSFKPRDWPLHQFVRADVREFFSSIVGDTYDIAYHFAAPVGGREKIEGDPLFNAGSLGLDAAFFRWAVRHTGIAVYPSSSAVYGVALQEGRGELLEERFFHPNAIRWDVPDEMYGLTKLVGEYLAWKASTYGLNTLCIRPFSGYGPGQSLEYPVPSIVARAIAREDPLVVWGSGEQRRDFVYIDDLVGATIARMDEGIFGYQAMNIASGISTSFNQVARLAANLVGYKPVIKNLVEKPSGVSSRFGSTAMMSRFYLPKVSLEQGLRKMLEAVHA